MQRFADKTVVVTGASEGIGAEIVQQLAGVNARLVLAARNENRLNEAAFRLRKGGARVLIVPTDVGDPDQCQRLAQQTVEHFGGIDVLINNAGVMITGALDGEADNVAIEKLVQVNLLGAIWCTRAALPALKAARGQIVGIASLAGKFGMPDFSVYCASKFGVSGFYEALRLELQGSGVDVTVIYPGVVATRLATNALASGGRGPAVLGSADAMAVADCAARILEATASRQRELVMSRRARLGLRLKAWLPGLVDRALLRNLPPAGGASGPGA